MGRRVKEFFKTPLASGKDYPLPTKDYFEDYEETYEDGLILINGVIKKYYQNFTDRDLWGVCFGGLRLDRFEVTRHGSRVEIVAKMRDIKEIREDIEEDKKKGIRI